MFLRSGSTWLLLVLVSPVLAGAQSSSAPLVASSEEPEEPDFAFLAGGPYTQKKNSIQFISPTRWDWRRGAGQEERTLATLLRFEWGITDRLELDVITNGQGLRRTEGSTPLLSFFTRSDTVVGMRYRLLEEGSAPLTLTLGPQVVLPTGRRELGTSAGRAGYAWDLALAKDWRGPFFVFASMNILFTPRAPAPASPERFNLQEIAWGGALGWRALEREVSSGSRHDIHVFLELGGNRADELEAEAGRGVKRTNHAVAWAPGVRYGFLTRTKKLFEIGASVPVGLNRAAPDFGLILQLQFEQVF